jgi:hypothetical protein
LIGTATTNEKGRILFAKDLEPPIGAYSPSSFTTVRQMATDRGGQAPQFLGRIGHFGNLGEVDPGKQLQEVKGKVHMLSPDHFKRVSDASIAHMGDEQPDDLKDGMGLVHHHIKADWSLPADAFLGLASTYDEAADCGELEELDPTDDE